MARVSFQTTCCEIFKALPLPYPPYTHKNKTCKQATNDTKKAKQATPRNTNMIFSARTASLALFLAASSIFSVDAASSGLRGLLEQSSCRANPTCKDMGLTGDCCPSTDPNGKMLDCCFGVTPSPTTTPILDTACSANPTCKLLGLMGDCCPSTGPDGKMLDCCFGITPEPTPAPTLPAACSANLTCKQMSLTGDCCPAPGTDGKMLDCCFGITPEPTAAPFQSNAACSAHPKCSTHAGDCCPTPADVFLDCCEN